MYDDSQIEATDKALLLIAEIELALKRGTKHYRASNGELLETPRAILEALLEEGTIEFEPVQVQKGTVDADR